MLVEDWGKNNVKIIISYFFFKFYSISDFSNLVYLKFSLNFKLYFEIFLKFYLYEIDFVYLRFIRLFWDLSDYDK